MEKWKTIEGYENYEVSTAGNVRNKSTGRILKPYENGVGYLQVGLCKDGKRKKILVHKLVASVWIPNPHNYDTVSHINHDREDNSVDNLQWMSKSNCGKNTAKPKMKKVYCYELDQTFDSIKEAGRKTGVAYQHIGEYCRGKRKTAGGYHWEFVES